MATKKDFQIAYCWMYDSTMAEAARVYREANEKNPSYIEEVVNCFRQNCRETFYQD